MAVAGKQVWAAMTGETNKRNQQPARFVQVSVLTIDTSRGVLVRVIHLAQAAH